MKIETKRDKQKAHKHENFKLMTKDLLKSLIDVDEIYSKSPINRFNKTETEKPTTQMQPSSDSLDALKEKVATFDGCDLKKDRD
ncbi:MAG: hypothetical protein H6925_03090 [Holosporaceae bacterium]|nr:MAG: hypothetical protein H6925_03090 [Holosporaceae bacterium]